MGKGEVARNQQFLLLPQWFISYWRTFCHFRQILHCRLQILWIWKGLNLSFGKGLTTTIGNNLCLWNTDPPQRPFFSKSVTMIFDLDWWPWAWYQQNGLVTRYTHMKYEGPKSYHSQCKSFCGQTNGQMNARTSGQAKNYMPSIYRCRGIKSVWRTEGIKKTMIYLTGSLPLPSDHKSVWGQLIAKSACR